MLSVATTHEENRIKTETVCLGRGLTNAYLAALHHAADAASSDMPVDQLICDLNGEIYRANELAFAVPRLAERFASPGEFLAPADCWGDVGAASGPLFAALAIVAGARGDSKGPRNLLSVSSEGGQRSAALLHVEAAHCPYR